MSIKQNGGVFGRNPTFNDVTIEGQLTFDGDIDINSDLKVAGDIETTGNVIIATSGKGIDFSATAGTGTSELLDDYEEGTWTPTSANTSSSDGTYTKIGNQVTVFGHVVWNGVGILSLTGSPFVCVKSGEGSLSYENIDLTAGTIQIAVNADVGGTTITGWNSFDNASRTPNTVTKSTSEIWFSVAYTV